MCKFILGLFALTPSLSLGKFAMDKMPSYESLAQVVEKDCKDLDKYVLAVVNPSESRVTNSAVILTAVCL